ncbi:hypothetical protein Tco_0666978 [Tanacetum coccineum]
MLSAAAASAAVASIPASATQSSSLFHKRRRLNKNKNSFSCRAVAGNNLGHFVQVVKKDVDFIKKNVTAGANWMSKVTRFPEISKKVDEFVWLRNFEDPNYDNSPSWPQPYYPGVFGAKHLGACSVVIFNARLTQVALIYSLGMLIFQCSMK